jgi:hypothetical protein
LHAGAHAASLACSLLCKKRLLGEKQGERVPACRCQYGSHAIRACSLSNEPLKG